MAKGMGIFETMRAGVRSEEEVALEYMFPAPDHFRRLQMMSDHQYTSMVPLSVMGLFRRMYKSRILAIFQEELNTNKISLNRLGRVEGAEIIASRKAAREAEEES